MIQILELDEELTIYLKSRRLRRKWEKAKLLLATNINYPGLNVEILEPKHRKIYSFRLDKKYRGIFLFQQPNTIEIIAFTNHYQ